MNRHQRHSRDESAPMRFWGMTGGQFLCLILFGFACAFGLGMIVARLDPSFEDHPKLAQEQPAVPETQTYSVPAMGAAEAAQAAETPAEPEKSETPAQKTPEMARPRSPFMDVSPQLTSLEPLPAQRSRPIQVEAPSREPRPGDAAPKPESEPKAETPPAQPTATATQPAPAPQPTAPAPQPQPAAAPAPPVLTPITPDEPLLAAAPIAAAQPPAARAAGRGSFGIQLGALSGSDRSQRAKTLQAQVQQKTGMQTEVIPSEDGQHHRVVVVGFQTRESATAALNDVRTKTGFKEAFVRAL